MAITATIIERPEPVLTQARYAKIVTTATPILLTVATMAGLHIKANAGQVESGALGVAGLVIAAVNWAAVHVTALRSRDHVTPLAAPVSATGEPLIALSAAKDLVAANAANAPLPEGEATAIAPAEDSTVVPA